MLPKQLLTPVQVAVDLINNNNIFFYAVSILSKLSYDKERKFNYNYQQAVNILKDKKYLNVIFLNTLSQVAPLHALKNANQKEKILKAFSDNVLLAKRNRQITEPVGAVLLLLSLKDRLLRVHTAGSKHLITDSQGKQVIKTMGPYLQQERFGKAIVAGLEEIERLIQRNKSYEAWMMWFRIWRGAFISPILILLCFYILKQNVIANYQKEVNENLENERIEEIGNSSHNVGVGNDQEDVHVDVDDNTCGICLESHQEPSTFDAININGYERRWYLSDLLGYNHFLSNVCNISSLFIIFYYNVLKTKGARTKISSLIAFLYCYWKYRRNRQTFINARGNSNSRIRTLACGHSFHASCINRWIERRASCPLCRAIIARQNVPELDGLPVPPAVGVGNNNHRRNTSYRIGDRVYVQTDEHSVLGVLENLPATVTHVSDGGESYDIRYHSPWRVRNVYPMGIRHNVRTALLTSWAWGSILYGRHRQYRYNRMRRRYRNDSAFTDICNFWDEISYGGRESSYKFDSDKEDYNSAVTNYNMKVNNTTTISESTITLTNVPPVLRGRDPSSSWYIDALNTSATKSEKAISKSKSWWEQVTSSSSRAGSSSSSSSSPSWGGGGGGTSGSW